MEDNKHTQGEWHLNNQTDDNGNIIIKRNPEYDNQEYFAITIKNSFNVVGFYYPSSKQSESEMIANAKIICQSVNEHSKLKEENKILNEQLEAGANQYAKCIQVLEMSKGILQSVYFMFDNYEDGTMGKRLSNEAKEILDNIKNKKL